MGTGAPIILIACEQTCGIFEEDFPLVTLSRERIKLLRISYQQSSRFIRACRYLKCFNFASSASILDMFIRFAGAATNVLTECVSGRGCELPPTYPRAHGHRAGVWYLQVREGRVPREGAGRDNFCFCF